MKILCVHGVGGHLSDLTWQTEWIDAISNAMHRVGGPTIGAGSVSFSMIDPLFARRPLTPADWARAAALLAESGLVHGLGDRWDAARGWLDTLGSRIRWTAGMVVQWVAQADLRKELRDLLLDDIRRVRPDVIVGHSLGSLAAYDLLADPAARRLAVDSYFVAIGSQIGHPAIRNVFGGRLVVPPQLRRWFHLYNPLDKVLTAPIKMFDAAERYRQIVTQFDTPNDMANHSAAEYIQHAHAREAWATISGTLRAPRSAAIAPPMARPPQEYKALIIGIDHYADANNNLAGCVNDAYLTSSALQETGFPAECIRLILNERATAAELRDRLEWLLADVRPGDVRYLHYSGHGAQLPAYGEDEVVDHLDECLCPHDFDFTPERAIVDNWFFELYSQLPYDAHFIATIDCCHSGGVTRAGSLRVRGLELPDDIRHRTLQWSATSRRWEPRTLPAAPPFEQRPEYAGSQATVRRLGRAIPLRDLPDDGFDAARQRLGHRGPFLPILFEACQESELAEEYRDGNTPYGAFTYSLMTSLRKSRQLGQAVSFADLLGRAGQLMRDLGFGQQAQLVAPESLRDAPVPMLHPAGQPISPVVPPPPTTPVEQAVAEHRDALLALPGVVGVRAGYRFRDGWITDERAVVITVRHKLPPGSVPRSALAPKHLTILTPDGKTLQVPTDVAPASPVEQLLADQRDLGGLDDGPTRFERELLGDLQADDLLTRAAVLRYSAPPNAALRKALETPVKERMELICHTSPGSSFSVFANFLASVKKRLIMGMYDLTAPHVVEALIDSLVAPRVFTLLLDPKIALGNGGGGDNPKAGDLDEETVRDDLEAALGDRFHFVWAAVKQKGKTSGGLFTNAYHIKVAVADGASFWLSSGNLQSTNQPKPDLPSTPTKKDLDRFNREWHVVVKNRKLSTLFEKYLKYDFEEARPLQAETSERAFEPQYDLIVPRAPTLTKALKTFKPKAFSKTVSIQPLLTPDNYAVHAAKFIRSAKSSLYFQNQYIHLGAEGAQPSLFRDLCAAIKEQIEKGLDVRVILRDLGDTRKMLEELQAFGITGTHIRLQTACHNKGILVDSKRVLIGSHNYSGAGTTTNRDASLIIEDAQVAAYFETIFLYDWENRAHASSSGERFMPIVVPRQTRNVRELAPQFAGVPLRRIPWADYFED